MSVLLYDDNQAIIEISRMAAEKYQLPLIAVGTIREALERFTSGDAPPDVLISDLSAKDIPQHSITSMLRAELFSQQNYGSTAGGAFIQKVRSNNPECRIILYGGNTHRDQTARELKVWGTVQKPISDDILRKLCILGSLTKDEQHKIENGMHVPVKLESGYLDHIKITREFE